MNTGACTLAFVAGTAFDYFGATGASMLGGGLASAGMAAAAVALKVGEGTVSWVSRAGFLLFGFGSTLLNTVAVLSAVKAVPVKHAGKASAGVLCTLALAMSVHSLVHNRWFQGHPLGFLWFQSAYSAGVALLGMAIFWRFLRPGLGLDKRDRATKSVRKRLQGVVQSSAMPWAAAVFMGPIAYIFALLGCWSACAASLGVGAVERAHIAFCFGITSALGRVVLGLMADITILGKQRLGKEVGFFLGLGALQLGFHMLMQGRGELLRPALALQGFGYGGLLALTPAVLRAGVAAEDLGTAYGLLYMLVAITFVFYNAGAVPQPGLTGAAVFSRWFAASGTINGICLLWALKRCIRATKGNQLEIPE